ncbi:hypothetical protein TNCV_4404251 [Trichonephila clavipes]|uniref:Uncharacterized protein n=1 Tax=Trichonephila clavipes TaxID=2585209 RepID=A0A8X6S6M6_TRICX|nr:hypothetical protein TNCV_4404251 [Trichonephila clavipes]
MCGRPFSSFSTQSREHYCASTCYKLFCRNRNKNLRYYAMRRHFHNTDLYQLGVYPWTINEDVLHMLGKGTGCNGLLFSLNRLVQVHTKERFAGRLLIWKEQHTRYNRFNNVERHRCWNHDSSRELSVVVLICMYSIEEI